MSELHKHLRSMQSTQEFSRLFSMCFLEKPSCSKANKQKNISPPPNPPKKQKKAKKTTRAKNHHPTPSPPTNQGPNDNQPTPTDPNRPQPTQPMTNRPQRLRGMVNAQKGIISGYGSGPKGVGKGDSGGTRLVSLVSRHHWGGVPCRFGTGYRVFIYIYTYIQKTRWWQL